MQFTSTQSTDKTNESIAWLLLVVVALALQAFLSLNTLSPYVIESGDNASILYIVAQWLNPEAFAEDVLLGIQGSTSFYQAAPMWLIYLLGLSGAPIGLFFVLLCFPVVMAQMAGFYLLGKHLFAHRGAAIALALVSVPTVFTLSGDLWGLSHSPLFRSLFGAALPWLLLLLVCSDRPRPFLLMTACAAATYLHLPSGPPIALLLIFVSFLRGFSNWGIARNLWHHLAAGILYLALILPYAALFALNYTAGDGQSFAIFNNSPYTDVGIALDQFMSMRGANRMGILVSRVPGLSWAKPVVAHFFTVLYLLGSAVLISLCLLWVGPERWRVRLNLAGRQSWYWIAAVFVGVVVFAVAISALDQAVAQAAGRAPLQVDFIRATRFLVPGSYLGILFLIIWCTSHSEILRRVGCVFLAVSVWLFAYPSTSHGLYRLTLGKSIEDESLSQLGAFILQLPDPNPMGAITPILRYDYQSSALRYIGYQPLTFNRKDNNFISYSGASGLAEHLQLMDEIDAIRKARRSPEQQTKLIEAFSEKLGSQYMVIDRRVVLTHAEAILRDHYGHKIIHENGLFALLQRK